jgi:hypothetical protein
MKIYRSSIWFLLLIPTLLAGQSLFTQGMRMGANLNVIGIQDLQAQIDFNNFEGTSAKFGYHFGAFSKLSFWKLHLQGDVIFTRVESEVTGQVAGIERTFDVSQNRLDFPLGLTLDIPFVSIGGGVGAALNVTNPGSLYAGGYKQFMTYWFLELSKPMGPFSAYLRFEFPDDAVSGFIQNPITQLPVSAETKLQLFRVGLTLDLN